MLFILSGSININIFRNSIEFHFIKFKKFQTRDHPHTILEGINQIMLRSSLQSDIVKSQNLAFLNELTIIYVWVYIYVGVTVS